MTKRELIDEIIHRNPTAGPGFLAKFEDSELAEYLQHLQWVTKPAQEPAATAGAAEGKPVLAAATATKNKPPFAEEPSEGNSQAWLF